MGFMTRAAMAALQISATLTLLAPLPGDVWAASEANTPKDAVRITMYDDGKSCPGGCDAHVVFEPALNSTQYAHAPSSQSAPFKACVNGANCEICLLPGLEQCLTVTYRGAGPGKRTFDFTPAFFESRCKDADAPDLLKAKCQELESAAASLRNRLNCFASPENAACKAIMDDAKAKQAADLPVYEACKKATEKVFNKGKPKSQQRSNDCAYEAIATGGPNSKGTKWRRLMPGACRTGTYVGRDGLDCCSGSTLRDGPLGVECKAFYPKS
ncbi:hypothetical protein [Cupriavidus sp. 8B]